MDVSSGGRRHKKGRGKRASPVASTSNMSTRDGTLSSLAKERDDLQRRLDVASENLRKEQASVTREERADRRQETRRRMYETETEEAELSSTDRERSAEGGRRERRRERSVPRNTSRRRERSVRRSREPSRGERRRSSTEVSLSVSEETSTVDTDSSQDRRKTRRAVRRILAANAPSCTNRGKKKCLPFNFVKRGARLQKVGPGEATWAEYFIALRVMVKMAVCPKEWIKEIHKHEDQLLVMAKKWDWPTCRQWSETIFVMICDGSLPGGWSDELAIRDVQKEITDSGKRLSGDRDPVTKKLDRYRRVQNSDGRRSEPAKWSEATYDKERDGRPCYPWNWGRDCGFSSSHGVFPEVKPHICAYCAYRNRKTFNHKEMDCGVKAKAVRKQNSSQDF